MEEWEEVEEGLLKANSLEKGCHSPWMTLAPSPALFNKPLPPPLECGRRDCGVMVSLTLSLSFSLSLLPDRALCLPTFSQFLFVNKTSLSLSLSLSLSRSR